MSRGDTPFSFVLVMFSNILKEDVMNREIWTARVREALKYHMVPYALVATQQLVGVCLFVYVQRAFAANVRDVALATRKVGMHGLVGALTMTSQ